MIYVCQACGFIYDEDLGDQERGIPAGTKFEDLPKEAQDYDMFVQQK